jgi:hypothetical protein
LLKVLENNGSQQFFEEYVSDGKVLKVSDDTRKLLVIKFPLSIEIVETLKELKFPLYP